MDCKPKSSFFRKILPCLRKINYQMVLLGLDGGGKTSILNTWRNAKDLPVQPTIGFNLEQINRKKVTFEVWDVGGQEHIRDLWKHYYDNEEMDGVLFVVDATDENRLKQAKSALQIILSGLSSKNSFICILANKQDKFSKLLPLSLIQEQMDLNNVLKNRNWKLFQVSATTGSGLEDVLKWIMAIE